MKYAALWAGIELTPIILSIFSHFSLLNWYLKLIPGINCFIFRYYSTQKSNKRYSRSTELYLINALDAFGYAQVLFTKPHVSFMALSVSASGGYEKSLDPRFDKTIMPALGPQVHCTYWQRQQIWSAAGSNPTQANSSIISGYQLFYFP